MEFGSFLDINPASADYEFQLVNESAQQVQGQFISATWEVGVGLSEDSCPSGVYDCLGICDGNAVLDCASVCNGNAVVDQCGVCNGFNASMDCAGVCNGNAIIDNSILAFKFIYLFNLNCPCISKVNNYNC